MGTGTTAYAQQDDHERACDLGDQALTLMAQLQAMRAIEYLRALQERLARHAKVRAVRQFNARATATIGRSA